MPCYSASQFSMFISHFLTASGRISLQRIWWSQVNLVESTLESVVKFCFQLSAYNLSWVDLCQDNLLLGCKSMSCVISLKQADEWLMTAMSFSFSEHLLLCQTSSRSDFRAGGCCDVRKSAQWNGISKVRKRCEKVFTSYWNFFCCNHIKLCFRPPGHHSQRNAANGFCLFNNVAIAAEYAKLKYGLQR